MKELFPIKETAAFSHIFKQTLIYYDKLGLFPFADVDPDNGDRYYSSLQPDMSDTVFRYKNIRCNRSLRICRRELIVPRSQL